ncbi:hypothetical protein E2C01_057654 [Portunus trituberculatus]|uniref:Uncharacterized protein n=1 Tax=Portunus trituberculatus TaxID=210409 RepID=A0A5B7H1Q6_PORTR|nr:hypothetical protein [Portunus trituberculatus]
MVKCYSSPDCACDGNGGANGNEYLPQPLCDLPPLTVLQLPVPRSDGGWMSSGCPSAMHRPRQMCPQITSLVAGGRIECSIEKYIFEILGRSGEEPRPWEVSSVSTALDV